MQRVVDYPKLGATVPDQGHGHGKIRDTVNEIGSTVDGVGTPQGIMGLPQVLLLILIHLFTQQWNWVDIMECSCQRPLRCDIRFCEQATIGLSFMGNELVTWQYFGGRDTLYGFNEGKTHEVMIA